MGNYCSHFLNLAWQLQRHLAQLIEHVFGCIDWIPQCREVQFSACYRGSSPGTERYIGGQSSMLSICNITEEQLFLLSDRMPGLPIFYMASDWDKDWHSMCKDCAVSLQMRFMSN